MSKKKSIWDKVGELMLKSQTTAPTSVTGGDAYGSAAMYALQEGDVEAAQEIQQQQDLLSAAAMGVGAGLVSIPGSVQAIGWVPALLTEGAAWGTGTLAANYGAKKDKEKGSSWRAPVYGILGGAVGGAGVIKGLVKAGSKGLLKSAGKEILGGKAYGDQFQSMVASDVLDNALKTAGNAAMTKSVTPVVTPHIAPISRNIPSINDAIKSHNKKVKIDRYNKDAKTFGRPLITEPNVSENTIDAFIKRYSDFADPNQGVIPYYFRMQKTWPTKPTKLSDLELKGVPKHDRTNTHPPVDPDLSRLWQSLQYKLDPDRILALADESPFAGSVGTSLHPLGKSMVPISEKHVGYTYGLRQIPDEYSTFASFLRTNVDDQIDPMFTSITSKDGKRAIANPIVVEYRKYLQRFLPNPSLLTDEALARVLTKRWKQLAGSATGKLKNKLLWHTTDREFETFDWQTYLGSNTRNNGLFGEGNYFMAGYPYHYGPNDATRHAQPFVFNGINKFSKASMWTQNNTTPIDDIIGYSSQGTGYPEYWDDVFIKHKTNDPKYPYRLLPAVEIVTQNNTGMKSLFPHPSMFVIENGKPTLKMTNWDDPRFNYKNGGKICETN